MNSWLIIKGSAISIQSPSRGCHGSEGRNLLRATGEPNWICGVSVYECVSTSSVHQNTMCWKAVGKSSSAYDVPRAGLGGSMQALKPRQQSWYCYISWRMNCPQQVRTFTKKRIKPIRNFRTYLFFEVSGNACIISLRGNAVLSLMSRERLDDVTGFRKLESQCHSCALHLVTMKTWWRGRNPTSPVNRVHWSKKPFPSLLTSVWPHLVYKVRKGGVFRRPYSASSCWCC